MKKELQDYVWQKCGLPKEFKEEVKKEYAKYVAIDMDDNPNLPAYAVESAISRRALLEMLFGEHNLTSDAEGEDEMLCVKRKWIQDTYKNNCDEIRRENISSSDRDCYEYANEVLKTLFGSKCLPDACNVASNVASTELKPAEPKYHIGQYVRHKPTRLVDVIDGISQTAPYIYHFKHMVNPINGQGIFESDLEPYTEPEGKLGMDARGLFSIDTDAIGNKIKVRIPSGVTEPYTEPKDEVVKMKPIESKVSVFLATKEEDEEFRTLLHKNGFMWSSGNALTSRSNWDSDHKDYQIHFIHPDKTVTFLGKRTEKTLTFTEFKKRYFGEDVNLSQETANCDKQFDTILKDGFRNERRLNIAAMIMQGILSNTVALSYAIRSFPTPDGTLNRYYAVAQYALAYADALTKATEEQAKK